MDMESRSFQEAETQRMKRYCLVSKEFVWDDREALETVVVPTQRCG